jgi:hypothetical protein
MSKKQVRAFSESGGSDYTKVALNNVVLALASLTEENRRRVIYATAVFYGVMPVMVDAPPRQRKAPVFALAKKKSV